MSGTQTLADRIAALPLDRVLQAISAIELEQERERKKERILSDDKFLEEYARRNYAYAVAIVRASTYKNKIPPHLEINGMWCGGDPNRPVYMRGSKAGMNKGPENISLRFFRKIKFTCYEQDKFYEMRSWLYSRLEKKGWYIGRRKFLDGYRFERIGVNRDGIWWDGEFIDRPNFNRSSWDDGRFDSAERIEERRRYGYISKSIKKLQLKEERQEAKKWWAIHEEAEKENRDRDKADRELAEAWIAHQRKAKKENKLRLKEERAAIKVTENRRVKAKQIAALELITEMENA